MPQQIGILLVNLGTPDSPRKRDVLRYLIEFLTDERVIDIPWLKRQFLVRGTIIPARLHQASKSYHQIWMQEGSPLMVYGKRLTFKLQERLGENYHVALGMRYQNPSLAESLKELLAKNLDELIILPLFPQYASATTGSVHQKVMEQVKHYPIIPPIRFQGSFADHPAFIDALTAVAQKYELVSYDHILFSFHGLPQRQLVKAYASCLSSLDCCQTAGNKSCYAAECYRTGFALATRLKLPKEKFSISFQSRLGRDPWLQPYTNDTLHQLVDQGKKKVLVFCPAFVCDCLETIYEIGHEYALEFKKRGGEQLDLVEGLNDHPQWVEALATILLQKTAS